MYAFAYLLHTFERSTQRLDSRSERKTTKQLMIAHVDVVVSSNNVIARSLEEKCIFSTLVANFCPPLFKTQYIYSQFFCSLLRFLALGTSRETIDSNEKYENSFVYFILHFRSDAESTATMLIC